MSKPFAYATKGGTIIREEILQQYAAKSDSKQVPIDTFQGLYDKSAKGGVIQPLYNPIALARLMEMNTYHYRACKTKARDAAGLGWRLMPIVENPNQTQYQQADNFFSEMDEQIATILDKVMIDYESIGYGAMELVRVNHEAEGVPALLKHIPSYTLRVHKDGTRYLQMRGNKKRWFKAVELDYDVDQDTGELHPLGSLTPERRATEVLWVVNYTPRSDYYGLPDVIPALGALHGDIARRDYNIAFFDNYGVPAYAVFITGNFDPGDIDEDGRSEFEKEIESHFANMSKSPHSTLVMSVPTKDRTGEVKIEFKPLSVDVKEASFRLYRQDNRDEILAAHGVPPYRMGIAETGSLGGSTAAESTEIYKRSVIEPRQEILEGLINRFIMWSALDITDWQFKLAEIDTADEKHDIDMADKLFKSAAMTPNQLISHFGERFGLEPSDHPAMDAHYLNGVAIDLEIDVAPEIEVALRSLQERLMEVAIKDGYESNKDVPGNREYIDVLASIKAIASKTAKSRS